MSMDLIEVFQQHMLHQFIHFHLVCNQIDKKSQRKITESFQLYPRVNNKRTIRMCYLLFVVFLSI